MRVGQLGGDVELEVIMVRNDGVTQLDHHIASLLEGLLQQYGFQGWVKLLPHVLQQAWLPKAHCVLQTSEEIFVCELDYIQCLVLFL